MDDKLKELYDGVARDLYTAQDHGLSRGDCMVIATQLVTAGYRLDPYPNGKSKGELIARIETVEAERDKTRNLLREAHYEAIGGTPRTRDFHLMSNTNCPVCTFLTETSSVKP